MGSYSYIGTIGENAFVQDFCSLSDPELRESVIKGLVSKSP